MQCKKMQKSKIICIHSVQGFQSPPWRHDVLVQPAATAVGHWRWLAPGTQQDFRHVEQSDSDQRQPVTPGQDDESSRRCAEELSHILTDRVHFACHNATIC